MLDLILAKLSDSFTYEELRCIPVDSLYIMVIW